MVSRWWLIDKSGGGGDCASRSSHSRFIVEEGLHSHPHYYMSFSIHTLFGCGCLLPGGRE